MYFGSNVKQCVGISMEQTNTHVTKYVDHGTSHFLSIFIEIESKNDIFSHYANINIGFETNRQAANWMIKKMEKRASHLSDVNY